MQEPIESADMIPQVSIIMPAFNAAKFLDQAVESICNQTTTNWELLAIDDCSTDDTYKQLKRWAAHDGRIRVGQTPVNSGVGGARDFGIKLARGAFIAMMDSDDVAFPERIESQINFMQTNPEIVGLGTQTIQIDIQGKEISRKKFPCAPKELYDLLYIASPIQVPTLMVNTTKLPKNFNWFESVRYAEDTLLFFKLLQYGSLANVPDFLQLYRYYDSSVSATRSKHMFYTTYRARKIGRQTYGYRASVKNRANSGLQWLVVTMLPNRVIPFVYLYARRLMLWISGHNV
jgi:glycosyltransferase involved in cell wall biosynthesis